MYASSFSFDVNVPICRSHGAPSQDGSCDKEVCSPDPKFNPGCIYSANHQNCSESQAGDNTRLQLG